ncbi:hypothetical protein DUI87_06438 [Hirundo rustica rustica]|uniref:SAM domain-containing protein n=1 Tax=Hirundo rustica rustica TaxID=333673 RepID=A0A3M0KTJ5_HIRRU|nr:hypothetical protein DUI87_06438 [Hirundo rustica rustica]
MSELERDNRIYEGYSSKWVAEIFNMSEVNNNQGSRLKMASCLYECLCEAELEKYYPHFAAFGLQKIDELANVSMEDYTNWGSMT